jgi:hypothetical protein
LAKVGRNDPCPCGSGKKYKRCHLDADATAARLKPAGYAPSVSSPLEVHLDATVRALYGKPADPVVYHYTSFENACAILRSREIWATAHHCTNDLGELTAANVAILDVARALETTRCGLTAEVVQFFARHYNDQQVGQQSTAYLACFSRQRDNANMWARYGDAGRGLCLGIRILDETHAGRVGLGSDWVEVVYSEDVSRDDVERSFSAICDRIDQAERTKDTVIHGAAALFRVAAFAAIQAKTPDWADEREVRLVTFQRSDVPDRSFDHIGADGVVRKRLAISARESNRRFALAEIIIGPACDPVAGRMDVLRMLADAGYVEGDDEYPRLIVPSAHTKPS